MRVSLALLLTVLFTLTTASAATEARAAEEKNPRWTLDLKPVHTGTLTANGVQGPGGYLYMVFKVKNNSGIDGVRCRLGIDVETDVPGRQYRGSFDPVVHTMVERKFNKKYKRMSQARVAMDDGDEIEVLAVFGRVDPNVDLFNFVIDGLKDRVYIDRYETWIEDTLRLVTYERKGDEFYRQYDLLKKKRERWITREERKKLVRKNER